MPEDSKIAKEERIIVMAHTSVAGELYESITGQLFEIGRQLRQPRGYPYDPAKLHRHLQDAIEGRFGGSFSIWRTLTIGSVSKDELLKRMADAIVEATDWAKDIMGKSEFKTSAEPHEVSFAKVKVANLGFTETPTTTQLFARIQEVGDLCEAEDGPHIRLGRRCSTTARPTT